MAKHKGIRTNLYYLDTAATPNEYKPWDGSLRGTVAVTGGLTDAELRASPVVTSVSPLVDNPEPFQDTSFVFADSPAILDFNTALGRNATTVLIINDGPGNFTYQPSVDGAAFGAAITMKSGEFKEYTDISWDSLRITWVSDSAYRVEAL